MRIVIVGHKSLPAGAGGIDRHVEELAATLAGMGHEVLAIGFRQSDAASELYVEEVYRHVRLVTVPSIRVKGVEATVGSLLAVLRATSLAGKDGVVHLHGGAAALWTWIPALFGRRVFVTVHALYWREKKWGRFGRKLLRIGEGIAARYSDRLIAVSPPVGTWLSLRWEVDPIVIPSGVRAPVSPIEPTSTFLLSNPEPFVLFCGRLIRDRRVEDLLCAAELVADCPSLVIVGPAEPSDVEYEKELHRTASDRTEFLGEVPFSEVTELMAAAAVMVNPSLVEGLSIAVLEALAMRCPLILSDIPENRAAAGDCARYFQPRNAESLAACLRDFLESRDDTNLMVGRGYQRTVDLYDWNVVAESVVGVYEGREPV